MKIAKVRCNNCMEIFEERKIIYDSEEDMEFCPCCGEGGCLIDLTEEEAEVEKVVMEVARK